MGIGNSSSANHKKSSIIKAILIQIRCPLKSKSSGNVNYEIELKSSNLKSKIVFTLQNRDPSNAEAVSIEKEFEIKKIHAEKVLKILFVLIIV